MDEPLRPFHVRSALARPLTLRPLTVNTPPDGGGCGAAAAATVTVTCFEVRRPPASATVAVTVWVPVDNARENEPPRPMEPSMLDDHARLEVRVPSCVSLAEPVNVTEAPFARLVPLAG